MEGSKGKGGWVLCLSAHSVRRKTKRRVRGPWDEIIPGNLERNFLKHRLGSRPFVAGLAVWSSPRTVSSPATSLSLAAICMASNERVLMLVSQGSVMALHTGLGSQVQAPVLWRELWGAADCPPRSTVHYPSALSTVVMRRWGHSTAPLVNRQGRLHSPESMLSAVYPQPYSPC